MVVTAAVSKLEINRVMHQHNATQRLSSIGDGVWTATAPFLFWGIEIGARMTVCLLQDGGVALISPIKHVPGLQREVEAIGPVRAIIAPSLWHHLFMEPWMEANPDAMSFGPVGLRDKRSSLTLTAELGAHFDEHFDQDLLRVPVEGMPKLRETLFFHHRSGTLIATDFCQYLPNSRGITALAARLLGIRHRASIDLLFRSMIRDRTAFRSSLAPLRQLSITHLSMCHHSVISDGAQDELTRLLDQLDVSPP